MTEHDVTLIYSHSTFGFKLQVLLAKERGWSLKTVYMRDGTTYATLTRPRRIY